MAVAEKPGKSKTSAPVGPAQRLALASIAGAAYLLFCLGLVFSGLPMIWESTIGGLLDRRPFLSTSLLLIITFVVIVGLIAVGRKLEGPNPLVGLRAGSVVGALGLFIIFLITVAAAGLLLNQMGGAAGTLALAAIVGIALVVGLGFLFFQRPFTERLITLEEQGWFHATGFKPSQGIKVRRGTLVGLLVVVGFGVFTAAQSRLFAAVLVTNPNTLAWEVSLPQIASALGLANSNLTLMHQINFTAPVVTFVLLAWVAWRVINFPTFADFLIATEAEMNKVSWTTRKRLIQDTIVVLVTVVLLTAFLFFVDFFWIKILSVPGVLQIDPKQEIEKQQRANEW